MGSRRGYRFEPRELPCGSSRLVIAFTVDRWWEAVYYQPQYDGDPIGKRFAITKRILLDALRVIFAEAGEPYDADALIDHIKSTTWGHDAQQLTARREPFPMPQDERLAMQHGQDPYADKGSEDLPT